MVFQHQQYANGKRKLLDKPEMIPNFNRNESVNLMSKQPSSSYSSVSL
jgi:hypothetical protein